jgi:hypothetical protein
MLDYEKERLMKYASKPELEGEWLVNGEDAESALEELQEEGLIERHANGKQWRLPTPEIKTIGDLFESTKYASICLSFPYGHCELDGHLHEVGDVVWIQKCCLHKSTPIYKSDGIYKATVWVVRIRGERSET